MTIPDDVLEAISAATRREAERIEKYGHVRAPISVAHAGQTFVAVGSRLLYNPKWKTFHDFLLCYPGAVFGSDWFTLELANPLDARHPLLHWYDAWYRVHAANRSNAAEGEIIGLENPPAQVSALLAFAYDLYTLEHHALLRQRLVDRLKRKEQFQGARYETYVAAAFVRAGFDISLEDEDDLTDSHVEFSALHRSTGYRYSVEAKSRHRPGFLGQTGQPGPVGEIEADLSGLLVPALRKSANHDRIVFVDINVPPTGTAIPQAKWFDKVAKQLKRIERNPQNAALPPAIVFITNFPYHFVGDDQPLRGSSVAFTGLNVPDFKPTAGGSADVIRNKFPAIVALHDSVLRHTNVPRDLT